MRTEKQIKKDLTELSITFMQIVMNSHKDYENMPHFDLAPMPASLIRLCKDYKTDPWSLVNSDFQKFRKKELTKKKNVKKK